ncbi:hypothetical protein BGY98DRAFT_277277 [Russula aff. rugulosa BPL654]|nr:hypothetical protein BGY98DRAFT_277277 [Russula aff. rugulosa BPL654]
MPVASAQAGIKTHQYLVFSLSVYNLLSHLNVTGYWILIFVCSGLQVQENPRAAVDVVRTPRDVIPVLGKRVVEEDLLEEAGTFFETSDKSVGSSDAHVSSGSAPPVPEHVDAQQPPPSPEPANPDHSSGNRRVRRRQRQNHLRLTKRLIRRGPRTTKDL